MNRKSHWEQVYTTRATDRVGWYTPHLRTSLAWIDALNLDREDPIIDVGGGASTLVDDLLERGAEVRVADPEALANTRARYGERITYCERNYEAVDGADALVVVTEWNEYRRPNFRLIRERMRGNLLVDGRNVWPRRALEDFGFVYEGIGT